MTTRSVLPALSPKELDQYGFGRAQDIAFDAVQRLWRRRQKEGVKQIDLARAIDMDPARLSKKLQGPSNWTLRTLGALVEAMNGELQIKVYAVDDPLPRPPNFSAYDEHEDDGTPGALEDQSEESKHPRGLKDATQALGAK
jgi:transcriptional regulator with XRE-family HTH domain